MVALAWRFDFDDIGTLVRQHHGRPWAGKHGRRVDYANTGKRTHISNLVIAFLAVTPVPPSRCFIAVGMPAHNPVYFDL
jgi:hypothetical protein